MRPLAINRKSIILLIIIFQLVLVTHSWSMTSNFGEMPDNCQAMSSKFPLLKSPGSNYAAVADNSSVDILCVGDDLVIDKSIYSNGGDIIIFAGSLQLNAALDSRLYYMPSEIISYQQGVDRNPNARSVPVALRFDQTQMQSFEAYYKYCVDCREHVFESGAGTSKVKKSVLLIPEFPHGLTPDYVWGPTRTSDLQLFMKPGLPPPDNLINFEKAKSGNIYIFANSVKVKDELRTPQIPSEIPVCTSDKPNHIPYAINAGGVRGGRGGAGTPSNCTFLDPNSPNPFPCGDATLMTSGITGPGGRGGDAGTVFIGIVSPEGPTDELRSIVSGIANIKGGAPGHSVKWLGPASIGQFRATGNVCDFYLRPQGNWPSADSGKDEEVIFKGFTRSEALSYLGALLGPKDASLDYDLGELAQRASSDALVRNASFDGYLISKIYDSLARAQVKVVIDINQVFQGRRESEELYVRPPFEDIKLYTIENSMLSKKSLIFLRELHSYGQQVDGGSPLVHYLTTSGGLFNLANAKPFDRFLSEATRTDISRLEIPLDRIVANLLEAKEMAVKIHVGVKAKEMQAILSRLAVLLQEAETRANRATSQQRKWLPRLVKSVEEAGKAVGVAYKYYYEAKWQKLAESLPAVWDKMGEVRNVYEDRFLRVSNEIPDLKESLDKAQIEYSLFVQESVVIRQAILEEKHSALLELLDDRSSHYSKLQNRLAQFHDLLRLSVIGLLLDPSKNREVFKNNLQSIVTFVEEFPMSEPYFRFRDVSNYCTQDSGLFERWTHSDECIYAKPSKEWSAVWSSLGFEKNKQIRVPLYVVAPSNTSHFLPSYGMENSLENIAPVTLNETPPVLSLSPRLNTQ